MHIRAHIELDTRPLIGLGNYYKSTNIIILAKRNAKVTDEVVLFLCSDPKRISTDVYISYLWLKYKLYVLIVSLMCISVY